MYRINPSKILLLLIAIAMTSCELEPEEEEIVDPLGTVVLDGVEYDLSVGYIQNNGVDADSTTRKAYETFLFLHSDGITIETTEENLNKVEGKGQVLRMHMYSSKGTELDETTYTYNYTENSIGTFNWATLWVDVNLSETQEQGKSIVDGSVTIEKEGSIYKITFDCTSKNGETVKGKYEGTLRYWEMQSE